MVTKHANSGYFCRSCGSNRLHEVLDYQKLKRVTSDCRPISGVGRLFECCLCQLIQKVMDADLELELTTIYETYQTYQNGIEPLTFSSGIGEVRTEKIYKEISCHIGQSTHGLMVDVGCGDGSFLRVFKQQRPSWDLYGFDLNKKRISEIEAICGASKFVSQTLEALPSEIDLITLNYVLEHIDDVSAVLKQLANKLSAKGVVTFLVPNLANNPYDLVVADHLSHYTHGAVIKQLRAGLFLKSYEIFEKELLIVGTRKYDEEVLSTPESAGSFLAQQMVDLLIQSREEMRGLARRHNGPFGIFGTAIAASWLSQEAADYDHFFVDEDSRKTGQRHLGKKVLLPSEIPHNSIVYLPFAENQARQIIDRVRPVTSARFFSQSVSDDDQTLS